MSWLFGSVLGLSLLVFTVAGIGGAVLAFRTRAHSLIAAAWSAILPGAGQWYAGARGRAAQFFVIDISLIVLGLLTARNQSAILKAWVRPRDLILMMIGSIALLVYRMWAAYDAHLLVADEDARKHRPELRIATVIAIGAVLLAPHAVFGYYDVTHSNLITTVFCSRRPRRRALSNNYDHNRPVRAHHIARPDWHDDYDDRSGCRRSGHMGRARAPQRAPAGRRRR